MRWFRVIIQYHLFNFILLLFLFLFKLLSCFSQFILQLLSKHILKGLKSSLIDTSWLLNCLYWLLVDSRRSINRGSTHSSSSGRLNSLRRLRCLDLFPDHLLNCSGSFFGSWLLGWAKWVIMIGHWKFVWLRSLELLLLLFLYSDGGLISRRRSSEVDRLFDIEAYCSYTLPLTVS